MPHVGGACGAASTSHDCDFDGEYSLKDELVRVKKPKDGVKTGVAEPAVLESSTCPCQ